MVVVVKGYEEEKKTNRFKRVHSKVSTSQQLSNPIGVLPIKAESAQLNDCREKDEMLFLLKQNLFHVSV